MTNAVDSSTGNTVQKKTTLGDGISGLLQTLGAPKNVADGAANSIAAISGDPVANATTGTQVTLPATPAQPGTASGSKTPTAEAGTSDYEGWAGSQGYTPTMLKQIYNNPWYLLPDIFKGISTASPGYQSLRDIGADPLSLYNIMVGSTQNLDQGEGAFANFMKDLYTNLGTAGGKGLDAQKLLGAIFGTDEFGANSKNTLGQILGAGDQSTQVRTLFNLIRDVSNAAMNPLAASAYQSAVAQAGDMYGNAMLHTTAGDANDQNFVTWMRNNLPHLAAR